MKRILFLLCLFFGVMSFVMPVDITAQMIPENIQEWFPAVTMAVLPAVGIPVASPNWNKIKCITEDQFKELQAKHGRLYQIDIHIDDTESYTFFAKRPSRTLLSAIANYASKQDYEKINELTINSMIVAGDNEALDDGVVFSKVMEELTKLMKLGESFLSKV